MDVSLVVMPFGGVERPAIGVSLLKAALTKIGVSVKIHYFNLELAERIGLELNNRLLEFDHSAMLGELIFSNFAFTTHIEQNRNIRTILGQLLDSKEHPKSNVDKIANEVISVQELLPEYFENCTSKILRERPKIVGFSSVYDQNCGSLSLAKSIKEEADLPIIFGGANCEGEMGSALLGCAPWVDYVCSGEGDIAFVEFIKSFLKGNDNPPPKINGIITGQSDNFDIALTNPVINMDSLPFPDYDDYFEALNHSPLKKDLNPLLVLETSRGCWWGEKFQCTFCGLNGQTMKYRSKSIPRVLDELRYLSNRHNIRDFFVVDNILDLKYIDGLFPEIYRQRLDVSLFYETKSNLSKDQLTVMKRGGVAAIQPGIESLSDRILNIMKKGVTGLRNIQLLKWCRELDIQPSWNLLWGFPEEPNEEYHQMARMAPLLVHLYPPLAYGKITLDRFSPYFLEPSQNGIKNVRPRMAYKYIYPLADEDLQKIAYHFSFDYSDDRDPSSYTKELRRELSNWGKLWQDGKLGSSPPVLSMVCEDERIMIKDTRPCSIQSSHILTNEEAHIYDLCETVHSIYPILIKMQEKYPLLTEDQLRKMLSNLIDKKLMLCDHDKSYLSLAIPVRKR